MPTPIQDIFSSIKPTDIQIGLEPAFNILHSMLLLTKADQVSGFSEWVGRTAAAMTTEEKEQHRLVMIGFYFAILPDRSWSSFPALLNNLAQAEPEKLRDKMLDVYFKMPICQITEATEAIPEPPTVDRQAVLADVESYLAFLRTRFSESGIDANIESQAFSYVIDPPRMQTLLVNHLKMMWDKYLAFEWERVQPVLEKAVRAFRQADLSGMDRIEAASWITGQDLQENKINKWFLEFERVIFVPSAHVGPYLGHFHYGNTAGILFGARLPKEALVEVPELSRAEIIVRLSALSDDSRLRILKFIAENGEQRSQDIINQLDLSQSATSRHLMQLSATGFLIERRCEGAKCYDLNPERVEDTLQAIAAYLLGQSAPLGSKEGVYYG
jgi:DNA-binding transcriptional ArsR family regulator